MQVTTIEANGEIILIADMINDYDYSDCINKFCWLQVASQAQYLSR